MPQSIQDKIRAAMTKKYPDGGVLHAADLEALAHIPYGISPRCLMLDLLIGRPGFPAGRITEICGLEHRGKSTLGYHAMAQCQAQGGLAVLIETENAYEAARLEQLHVNTHDILLLQPEHIEQAFEMMSLAMKQIRVTQKFTGPVVMVLDTVARLPSASEFEGDFDDKQMANAARTWSHGLRKFVRTLGEYKIVLLFLNQLTHTMVRYGDPYTSYGGQAIKSTASLRISIEYLKKDLVLMEDQERDMLRQGGKLQGAKIRAYTMKNKLAIPFQTVSYYLDFDRGIDPYEDLWLASQHLKLLRTGKGSFQFTFAGKSVQLSRRDWQSFVTSKFKTPEALRERLVAYAIDKGVLKPYGQSVEALQAAPQTPKRPSTRKAKVS